MTGHAEMDVIIRSSAIPATPDNGTCQGCGRTRFLLKYICTNHLTHSNK